MARTTDKRLMDLEAATAQPAPPRARYKPGNTEEMLEAHGVDLAAVAACPGASTAERLACWLGVPYGELMADLKARAANARPRPEWNVNWWDKR